jgi:wyosine [tRNA(Phe)-imidazoG37] synthetase (radical SAM superfamily)
MEEGMENYVNPAEHQRAGVYVQGGRSDSAFGSQRDFLDNRFVYVSFSPRAHGLSVGINLNPDHRCNFHCVYCEAEEGPEPTTEQLDVDLMATELQRTLAAVFAGRLRDIPTWRHLPDELLQLRQLELSGSGEPTLSLRFPEALETVMHVRASGGFPFFKLVLVTNGSGLDLPLVARGLGHLARSDEVWIKLDGGTQAYVSKVNRTEVPLEKILSNILKLGLQRPVVIQSLFPALHGVEPPLEEIDQYAQRLLELKNAGAQIGLVQIYSASPASSHPASSHLPLKTLARIAKTVRQVAGLKTEVF